MYKFIRLLAMSALLLTLILVVRLPFILIPLVNEPPRADPHRLRYLNFTNVVVAAHA